MPITRVSKLYHNIIINIVCRYYQAFHTKYQTLRESLRRLYYIKSYILTLFSTNDNTVKMHTRRDNFSKLSTNEQSPFLRTFSLLHLQFGNLYIILDPTIPTNIYIHLWSGNSICNYFLPFTTIWFSHTTRNYNIISTVVPNTRTNRAKILLLGRCLLDLCTI